ncbi:MAG: 1-(5-phosphoribosyl)-5-[(5-phosphoribosylamino)methylideneamino] imidazole-4-carboxamide isomerase [Hydrogenophilaceae bacterium]|jgi:phosphoribosylformimino-5-aminoimidazole carboxamide ribotide isomerase|nr:1-(5-phosphoribosyl)-5-[(5-phosphoribosylamino)methylideneamino] imidazole-4-carboxamide isomerase [Hydrogenophilaceae bacterium]
MLIYPAIDLIEGRCVRLVHGDFDAVTRYGDPRDQIAAFADAGATWAHVVDLDGARAGRPAQLDLIAQLARAGVHLQCGGGVRARADAAALIEAGVRRVVVGSTAVRRPDEVRGWIAELGAERMCCAFDVRAGESGFDVAVDGWRVGTGRALSDVLADYPPGSLTHTLITDISRDGTLEGPNAALMAEIIRLRSDLRVQASGGVGSLDDLKRLRATGAAGAIVGKALYEKKFSLEDALAG